MQRRDRHQRVRRLLTCASAALILAATYANVAQAGLSLTGSDPVATTVATAGSTVGGVTSTATGNVDSATSATGAAAGGGGSTVSTVTETVQNATQAVSGATQAVSNTVDQTVATAETTVDNVAGTIAGTGQAVERTAAAAAVPTAHPASSVPPAATPASSASADQAIVTGDAGTATAQQSAEAVVVFTRVDTGAVAPTKISTLNKPRAPHVARAASTQPPQATSTAPANGRLTHSPPSLQRAPRAPLPGLPSSMTTLFAGSAAGVSSVLAALLGAVLVATFGRPGARPRPSGDPFRPHDVLFQLERPG